MRTEVIAGVRMAWHGGASYTLDLMGVEALIDPAFSRPGDYPPWFDDRCANPHAPDIAAYLRTHQPPYVFISHGHFDHFDLRTVERLFSALDCHLVGSAEVLRTCRDTLGVPERRLLTCPLFGEGWLALAPAAGSEGWARVSALPGPHWFTGPEGDAVAAKLAARPERYGAMPCGGPMLGFIFETARGERLFASGDTEAHGLPDGHRHGPFDVAIISCGGELVNPATRLRQGPYLDEASLARAACTVVRPRLLVPVHYDHPVFQTGFDLGRLATELSRYPLAPRLVKPGYNSWTVLDHG